MRKTLVVLFALLICGALPLFAQEKETAKEVMPSMMPPKPLTDHDFFAWMTGEWEGWSTSPMGKSQDWQKLEWSLDDQFLMWQYTAKTTEPNMEAMKAMSDAMKMSKEDMDKMMNTPYKGMGMMTINPANDEVVAYWFDSYRGTYKGTGKREGMKIVTTWESPMGSETRVIEKVSDDKMVMTFKGKDPTGKEIEGRSELTRTKMAGKS